ncbi:LpxL/LpxP family acyltransferase [Necropsobacter massiliensis]|uniref:LpxL/LpxP family acyltransferase n=1 Tax=Necropsobacter massiliensis TaxID=1400001 RepID=UPI00059591A2|nr:glycosyl transferase family 2 [Necropsobacter massiliensis]
MNEQHWARQTERGNGIFLHLTRLIVLYFPLPVIRFVTFWIVLYFFLTSRLMRKYIAVYQQRLCQTCPFVDLPAHAVFRQFLNFGEAIADRFAVWQGKIRYQDVIIDDQDNLCEEMNAVGKRGQILLCAHFGNVEISRALIKNERHPNFCLNILVHHRHAAVFNRALHAAGADELSLIQVDELDARKMLELHQRIERGEWIAIAGDRIPLHGEKTETVNFLGQSAVFPQGVWLLSSLLKAPVNTIFCLKEQGRYRLQLRRFCPAIAGRGKIRRQNIHQAMQKYADELAKECAKNPLLWFNFYDFWNRQP